MKSESLSVVVVLRLSPSLKKEVARVAKRLKVTSGEVVRRSIKLATPKLK